MIELLVKEATVFFLPVVDDAGKTLGWQVEVDGSVSLRWPSAEEQAEPVSVQANGVPR